MRSWYLKGKEELYAALSMGSMVGLHNTWKEKLREGSTRKYILPADWVVQGLNSVTAG